MTFHIPGALREFAGGHSSVEIEHEPAILHDVLGELWQAYPGLRDRVLTEQGQVRTHINIFIGNENIRYLGGLAARVPADASISIIPAVSGGSSAAWNSRRPGGVWRNAGGTDGVSAAPKPAPGG